MAGRQIGLIPKRTLDFTSVQSGQAREIVLMDGVDVSEWGEVSLMVRTHSKAFGGDVGRIDIFAVADGRTLEDPGILFASAVPLGTVTINNATPAPSFTVANVDLNVGPVLRIAAKGTRTSSLSGPNTLKADVSIDLSVKSGVARAWTPSVLTPLAWYHASAAYITESGGAVSAWADRSGHGYTTSQGTGSLQPTYSPTGWNGNKPALSFDGANDFLESTAAGLADAFNGDDASLSVFAVLKLNADVDGGVVTWDSGVTARIRARIANGGPIIRLQCTDNTGAEVFKDSTVSLGTSSGHVVGWVRNGASCTFYVDGNAPESATLDVGVITCNSMKVGAGTTGPDMFLNGLLSEVVIMAGARTPADFASFRAYAQSEWGGLP